MEILNIWNSKIMDLRYYNETNEVFNLGDYKIFKQSVNCHLYTFKNIGISQLVGLNKDLIRALHEDKRPIHLQQGFLFDRCKNNIERGLKFKN